MLWQPFAKIQFKTPATKKAGRCYNLMVVGDLYFDRIEDFLRAAEGDAQLFEAIVNAPFHDKIQATQLDLGIAVLLLVNKATGMIDRIALSDTEQAAGAVKMSEKPFKAIKIPVGHEHNAIAKAIDRGEPQHVTDWAYLFAPGLSPRAAHFNQAGAGIEYSCVFPLKARDGGAMIFSYYQEPPKIKDSHRTFMKKYVLIVEKYLSKGDQSTHSQPTRKNLCAPTCPDQDAL